MSVLVKRSGEHLDPPSSMAAQCSPFPLPDLSSPASKRFRRDQQLQGEQRSPLAQRPRELSPYPSTSPQTPPVPSIARHNSPFVRLGSEAILDSLDESEMPRKIRRKMSQAAAEQQEVTLTMGEVKEVVQRALEIQEERLRAAYDAVLVQQLREQWESFSRFSSEHLSRQVSSRDFSYCT